MNKQEVYAFLKEKNLDFEITEHPAVYSMEELAQVALPYPEADAKNLFVRDDKKRNYYLITVKGRQARRSEEISEKARHAQAELCVGRTI